MAQTIQTAAGRIIVAGSRGAATQQASIALRNQYGPKSAAAMKAAGQRQKAVTFGLQQAAAQAHLLQIEIERTRTVAVALKSMLEGVRTAALIDLDNPEAGDPAIAALTALLASLATALTGIGAVSSMTYRTYRDA